MTSNPNEYSSEFDGTLDAAGQYHAERRLKAELFIKLLQKYAICAVFGGTIEPDWEVPMPSRANVNWFVDKIQGYFEDEIIMNRTYWEGKGKTQAPPFDKLDSQTRLAMYQEWQKLKV